MPTHAEIIEDFNTAINTLSEAATKLQVYLSDWDTLPTEVKDSVKAQTNGSIDTQTTELLNLKASINNL